MDNIYKTHFSGFAKGSMLVIALLTGRSFITHNIWYWFLLWNLFLAFVPFVISSTISHIKPANNWLWWMSVFVWLLFFPNAPYIITDFEHLRQMPHVPIWYDSVLLFVSALNGLWIGCISLMQMEQVWHTKYPKIKARYFLALVMLLSGFGVYLGRVLRFNTWDILTKPSSVFDIVFQRVFFPWQNLYTWAVTVLFAGVLWMAYAQVRNFVGCEKVETR